MLLSKVVVEAYLNKAVILFLIKFIHECLIKTILSLAFEASEMSSLFNFSLIHSDEVDAVLL